MTLPAQESTQHEALVVVAFRSSAPNIKQRVHAVLALAEQQDTAPCVFAKDTTELVATDLDNLAHFMGWGLVRDLNVGDVVAETGGTNAP